MNRLKKLFFNLRFSIGQIFGREYQAKECGHFTKCYGWIEAFGEKIPIIQKREPDYCFKCLSKMTIRCAWCGKPIFICNPVTLYTPPKGFQIPQYAVVYNDNPVQLVGCLRVICNGLGADRMGFWVPPGKVQRVLSPAEMVLNQPNSVVIDNNQ